MTVGFMRAAALVALAGLASGCNFPAPATNGLPAPGQPAPAAPPSAQPQPQGGYQVTLIAGSATWAQDAIRMNTTTGKTDLSPGAAAFIPVTEAAPIPAGSYRLYSWTTFDNGATTREWDVYRLDTQTGRFWAMNYDGKTTASWAEIVASHGAAPTMTTGGE
jgi:hypothetical protein